MKTKWVLFLAFGFAVWLIATTKTAGARETAFVPRAADRPVIVRTQAPLDRLENEVRERARTVLILAENSWHLADLKEDTLKERVSAAIAIAKANGLTDLLDSADAVSAAIHAIAQCELHIYLSAPVGSSKQLTVQNPEMRRCLLREEAYVSFLEALFGKPPAP